MTARDPWPIDRTHGAPSIPPPCLDVPQCVSCAAYTQHGDTGCWSCGETFSAEGPLFLEMTPNGLREVQV